MANYIHRKLAAILFADIAGYTDLMQKDEPKALDAVNHFKQVIESKTPEFGGEVIQYFGDGCLMSFGSGTEGVECAIAMQELFLTTNKIPVRIGLHLGDVVLKDDNVYGNGVNVASRIESLGVPGCVLLSKSIKEEIKNKKKFNFQSVGFFEFKNVDEPMEVFAICNDGFVVPERHEMKGKLKPNSSINTTGKLKEIHVQKDLRNKIARIGLPLIVIAALFWIIKGGLQNDRPILDSIPAGKKYVLSIGIDNYPNWKRLSNAVNDAQGFMDVMQGLYGFMPLGNPILNENATQENILKAIKDAEEILTENDQLIIFFAGHGYNELNDDNSTKDPVSFLVPYDANSDSNTKEFIRIGSLLEKISSLPALHITTILDACFSGIALRDEIFVSRSVGMNLKRIANSRSRKVFSSADYDQTALDNGPIKGHSLFTGILIRGLKTGEADRDRDGIITMNELAIYLEGNIYAFSDANQIPQYGFHPGDEGGEMLLPVDLNKVKNFPIEEFKIAAEDIYTALAFRTSSSSDSYIDLKTYLPDQINRALTEHNDGSYKVYPFDDAFINPNRPHAEILTEITANKYFTGSFDIFADKVNVNIDLYNSQDRYMVYSFPTISGSLDNLEQLAFDVKKRIKGFLETDENVLAKITHPPDYEAYKWYIKGRDTFTVTRDGNKARPYFEKAIQIDSLYFPAYLYIVWTYFTGKGVDMEKAGEAYERLFNPAFDLLDFEELQRDNLAAQYKGNFETASKKFSSLFKKYPTKWVYQNALEYALLSNNLSIFKELIKEKNVFESDQKFEFRIHSLKNEYYQMSRNRPSDYEKFIGRYEELITKMDEKSYYSSYFESKTMFDCDENCFEKLDAEIKSKSLDNSNMYKYVGIALERNPAKKGDALKAFKHSRQKYLESVKPNTNQISELKNLIYLNYKTGNYQEAISLFEKNRSTLEDSYLSGFIVTYYLLSKLKQNGKLSSSEKNLLEKPYFVDNKAYLGLGWYMAGVMYSHLQEFELAMKFLRKSSSAGWTFSSHNFDFDADLQPIWDYPDFKRFVSPK